MKDSELLEDLGMQYATNTSKRKHRFGLFKCGYCGSTFKAQLTNVAIGTTKGCGCLRKTHGKSNHPMYTIWTNMLGRVTNKKHNSYDNYGGNGITVCDRWMTFDNFFNDMEEAFNDGLSLDRIDNNKGYSPENCRWTTKEVQARNTKAIRANNTSGYRGVTKNTSGNKWTASIGVNKKYINLGSFSTAAEAGKAYDEYVIKHKLEHTTNSSLTADVKEPQQIGVLNDV
jgi:hypothetical protein